MLYVINEIAFEPDGSICGTGEILYCCDGSSWGTISYTPGGGEHWVSGPDLSTPGHSAQALAIDKSGAVYTEGDINATIKYSSTGQFLWMRRYGDWNLSQNSRAASSGTTGGDVAVDDSGYAYVLTSEFMTIKFNPQGDTIWTRTYHDVPNSGFGRALAVSKAGDVWVTGVADEFGTGTDIVTIHYSSQGDSLWTRYFDGPAHGDDGPRAVVVDDSDNVCITGTARTGAAESGFCTLKYTPPGDTAWVRIRTDSVGGNSSGGDIAVDPSGQVYVTGYLSSDYGTIKYSPEGQELWARKQLGPGFVGGYALALDDSGSVYVTGLQNDTSFPATVKYSRDGDFLWGHRTVGTDILVDDSGYVYVATYFSGLTKLSQFDADSDGIIDLYDNCYGTPNAGQANGDGDSLGDACDNCPQVTNGNQAITVALAGDVNQNGLVTSADIIQLVHYVFKGGPNPLPCVAVGDINCSGSVTSADIVTLVNHVFKAGPPPCDVCQADHLNWSCP